MGAGQFCTNPGLVVLLKGAETDAFVEAIRDKFQAAAVGTLLSKGVQTSLQASLKTLQDAGAEVIVGDTEGGGQGYCHANTLLRVQRT